MTPGRGVGIFCIFIPYWNIILQPTDVILAHLLLSLVVPPMSFPFSISLSLTLFCALFCCC